MTLEQKVGQMVQAEIRDVTPEDVRKYRLGSILNGGGAFPNNNKHAAVADWVALADRFYDASMDTSGGAPAIPIIWGTDAVHGHNNVIGATLFPHNIGLGAAHDPDLIQRIGEVTAHRSCRDWHRLDVRADGCGRSRRSLGAHLRGLLRRSGDRAHVRRAHGASACKARRARRHSSMRNHVIATAKHFIGDGGTNLGVDRGDNLSTERAAA